MNELTLSKTKRKQRMHRLQRLGEALAQMPEKRLALLALPADVRQAIAEWRRLTQFEARRRQAQYLGRLLQRYELEVFEQTVAALAPGGLIDQTRTREAQRLAQDFWDDERTLGALLERFPGLEAVALRQLRRQGLRELGSDGPTAACSALVAMLRAAIDAHERIEIPERRPEEIPADEEEHDDD